MDRLRSLLPLTSSRTPNQMESRETSRHGPLPLPRAAKGLQARKTKVVVNGTTPTDITDCADTQQTPLAPNRLQNIESARTTARLSKPDPPTYESTWQDMTDPREPEPVSTQDHAGTSTLPHTAANYHEGWTATNNDRDHNFSVGDSRRYTSQSGWDIPNFDTAGRYSTRNTVDIRVNGRQNHEEIHWWDPGVRACNQRPGPGILPPILYQEMHNPDHSLFSVSYTIPEPLSPQSSEAPPATHVIPPTEDEIRTSVPHPNAYYCSRENGWVILSWGSSSILPLTQSSEGPSHFPLPDKTRRKRGLPCVGDAGQGGQMNKTHHFHKYPRAIDSLKLNPPFKVEDWDVEVARARLSKDASESFRSSAASGQGDSSPTTGGKLFDLYVCCQCPFYCVASSLIPGIIPRGCIDELVKDRQLNPPAGNTGAQAVVLALETILLILSNVLWRGDVRPLKVISRGNKVGWNSNVRQIFESLGFVAQEIGDELCLVPPIVQYTVPVGQVMRRKLLRAGVEIAAWLAEFRRRYDSFLRGLPVHDTHVKIDNAGEMYQMAIGAHPDQIPRNELSISLATALQPLGGSWTALGLTLKTYSPELLAFAYLAQCRCDPANTAIYFSYLSNIIRAIESSGEPTPELLQDLLVSESSRGRFTIQDVADAASTLGFGLDRDLGVELDDDGVDDDFIENVWREIVEKSWGELERGSALRRRANEAFRIIAEARGSSKLLNAWKTRGIGTMSPDSAYKLLEISETMDDDALIKASRMQIEERLNQIETIREALGAIAEMRDSQRLRQFLSMRYQV